MAANFQSILAGATLGEIEKPKPLPVGSYQALIKSFEFGESKQKQTPYVRVNMEIVAPMSDVNEADLEMFGGLAKLQGKKIKHDFYLTDASMFMLQEFVLDHVGLDLKGMSLDQGLPQIQNQVVGVRIQHRPDDKKPDIIYAEVAGTFKPE